MHFHSPLHFPFHKNRCIYSEFLWRAGLAEKGPCTDLLSSEPSSGIPSLFFLHEARRKILKSYKKWKNLWELEYLFPWPFHGISWWSTTKQNDADSAEQAVTESLPCLTATSFQVCYRRQYYRQLLKAFHWEMSELSSVICTLRNRFQILLSMITTWTQFFYFEL